MWKANHLYLYLATIKCIRPLTIYGDLLKKFTQQVKQAWFLLSRCLYFRNNVVNKRWKAWMAIVSSDWRQLYFLSWHLDTLTRLILKTNLRVRYYCFPHLHMRKTKNGQLSNLIKSEDSNCWRWNCNPSDLAPGTALLHNTICNRTVAVLMSNHQLKKPNHSHARFLIPHHHKQLQCLSPPAFLLGEL